MDYDAIVLGAGLGPEGGEQGPAVVESGTFRLAFLAAILGTAAALISLWRMPERPLRDTIEPSPAEGPA